MVTDFPDMTSVVYNGHIEAIQANTCNQSLHILIGNYMMII